MDNDSHKIFEAFVYFGQNKLKKTNKEEEGDLMSNMKEKGMISKDASTDTGKYGRHREEEERRLDPKCWKGYHKEGTKMKGGKRVNNCVKSQDEEMPAPTFYQMLERLKNKGTDKAIEGEDVGSVSKQNSGEEYSAQDFVADRELRGEAEEGTNDEDEDSISIPWGSPVIDSDKDNSGTNSEPEFKFKLPKKKDEEK